MRNSSRWGHEYAWVLSNIKYDKWYSFYCNWFSELNRLWMKNSFCIYIYYVIIIIIIFRRLRFVTDENAVEISSMVLNYSKQTEQSTWKLKNWKVTKNQKRLKNLRLISLSIARSNIIWKIKFAFIVVHLWVNWFDKSLQNILMT